MYFMRMSFTVQMIIAVLLGILVGIFFGDYCKIFAAPSSAYIMIMKITAIPYLICAIIHGVGQFSPHQGKEILKKGAIFVGIAWAINIATIYLTVLLFPGANAAQGAGFIVKELPPINFAELLIPDNIFYALANNILPAVVVFSLLIGLSLMRLKHKEVMMQGLENIVDSLTRITGWLSRITPIGTFIIIANQIGTIQLTTVKQVSTYLIFYIVATCLIVFWIFPKLISMLTPIKSYKWLELLFPILLLGYTTNAVIVCVPYIIQLVQKETQNLCPRDESAQMQTQGVVSILFNLPLGSLFITIFIFFVSIFYNTPLSIKGQIELFVTTFLTGLGAVGLGSWINTLNFLLDALALPLDAMNLYLITLPFTAGFQSMVSIMEIASLSLLITIACRQKSDFRWPKIIKKSIITILPILLLVLVIKALHPFPKIQNETITIYECNIPIDVEVAVLPETPSPTPPSGDVFEKILSRGILRVGYNPNIPPFCFINNFGNVVGYDMAFAYELAENLGCKLELVPMHYGNLAEELNSGIYDLAMSAVTITEDRLKQLYFTKPYVDAKIVFVVKDSRRKELKSPNGIRSMPQVKIAVLKGSSFVRLAEEYFPDQEIVLIENYDDFANDRADVLLWEEQEAISWVLRHPPFQVVFPSPSLGKDSLGYAMQANNPRLLNFLNQWLKLKDNEGFIERQNDLWILGKTKTISSEEKRWSIVRDVLHWAK